MKPTENLKAENLLEQKLKISYSANQRILELIDEIEFNTEQQGISNPRGLKVKEALMAGFMIDTEYPCLDFKSRPFNYKYFAGEVAWYLYQNRKVNFINNFSKFWNNIKDEDNKVNSNYGHILLKNRPTTSQVAWIVNTLKKDKNSRQAIAFISDKKYQYEGNKDFVCTLYLNFFIRNNTLYMKVQMRSQDIIFGSWYDLPWFSTVHQNVYLELQKFYPELQLGKYFHFMDNAHFYERHFDLIEKIKSERDEITAGPKLTLKKPLWISDENGETEITKEAKNFLNLVSDKIKIMDNMTWDDWRTVLETIYDIN